MSYVLLSRFSFNSLNLVQYLCNVVCCVTCEYVKLRMYVCDIDIIRSLCTVAYSFHSDCSLKGCKVHTYTTTHVN